MAGVGVFLTIFWFLLFVKFHLLFFSLAFNSFTNFLRGKRGLCLWERKKGGMFFSVISLSDQTETVRHTHNTHRWSREILKHTLSLELLLQTHSEYRWIFDHSGFSSWNLHLHHVCFYCHPCSKYIIIFDIDIQFLLWNRKKLEEVFKLSQPPSFHSNGCCNCNDSKEKNAGSHLGQALRMLNSTSVRNPRK